jgi:ribosomal protein S25
MALRLKKSNKVRSPKKFNLKNNSAKKSVVSELTFRYNIKKSTAKKEIQDYIHKHPWSLTSEIIENLRIEPPMAVKILKELKNEGLAVSKPVV